MWLWWKCYSMKPIHYAKLCILRLSRWRLISSITCFCFFVYHLHKMHVVIQSISYRTHEYLISQNYKKLYKWCSMQIFPCHPESIKMQFFNDDIFALRAFSMQYKINFDGNKTVCKENLPIAFFVENLIFDDLIYTSRIILYIIHEFSAI